MTWWGWLILVLVALYAMCVTAAFAALLFGVRALAADATDRARRLAREDRANEQAMDLFRTELKRRAAAWPRR